MRTRSFAVGTLALKLIAGALAPIAAAQGTDVPTITRATLANGSWNTASRTVALAIATTGATPTAFRTSERADMSGATWRKFSSSPSITLSSELGAKIVFVQVGTSPSLSTTLSTTRVTQPLSSTVAGDFVPAPTVLSNIARDTIINGLPDIQSAITMPSTVRNGQSFEMKVLISNFGQTSPPNEPIQVYNSFVTNTLQFNRVEVNFLAHLRGEGCVITDTSTVECTIAPLARNGAMAIHLSVSVVNALTSTQTQVTHTLRTRISGIRESNTTNNWRDTPITIVK